MPHTLLLADDSLTIQRVIELTFADRDVSVLAVSTGDEAVRLLTNQPPDIVLADIDMPGPTGYEIAQHVRRTPSLAHIPVLLLTGAFEPIDEDRARAAGSDGVLTKPFDPGEVVRRVNELLARRPSDGVSDTTAPARPSRVVSLPVESEPEPVVRDTLSELPSTPHQRASSAVDDYFEQLDQAFAARLTSPPRLPSPPPDESAEREPARPILASAFSALLDAESTGADDVELASWFASAAAAPATPVISDEVIEQIARRVVERLSDRVVRETVASVVSTIAERLVTEEIERIKSNIK